MKSKITITIILMTIFLIGCSEEGWVLFLEDGQSQHYFLKKKVNKTKIGIFTSVMSHYLNDQTLTPTPNEPITYRSLSQTVMFDCEKQQYLAPDVEYFDASGKLVHFVVTDIPDEIWKPINESAVYSALFSQINQLCAQN